MATSNWNYTYRTEAPVDAAELIAAINSKATVQGLTHSFYRYPARFSPAFANASIRLFSQPGDLVLDPFMGSGTTLVEARALGRLSIGTDINSLAVFIAKAKTTVLSDNDAQSLREWSERALTIMKVSGHESVLRQSSEKAYTKHLHSLCTWRLKKLLHLCINSLDTLDGRRTRLVARCVLLGCAQWALDCRHELPTVDMFRARFRKQTHLAIEGALKYASVVRRADRLVTGRAPRRTLCLHRSAMGIESDPRLERYGTPRLVVTSPPYPGVHVLYHRWQIQSRKETDAAYWIADCEDGTGSSYYTFGDRKQPGLSNYFTTVRKTFSSISRVCDRQTTLVQLVGFTDPSWQIQSYLDSLSDAGFTPINFNRLADLPETLIARQVPNRKWYAEAKGDIPASKEVLFVHRLR